MSLATSSAAATVTPRKTFLTSLLGMHHTAAELRRQYLDGATGHLGQPEEIQRVEAAVEYPATPKHMPQLSQALPNIMHTPSQQRTRSPGHTAYRCTAN